MLLTFDFKTPEEAAKFLEDLIAGRPAKPVSLPRAATSEAVGSSKSCVQEPGSGVPHTPPAPSGLDRIEGETVSVLTAEPEPVAAPSKRSRKPKIAAEAPTFVPTIDDCRQALSDVLDAKGYDEAARILSAFQAAKVGDVKFERAAEFVQTCKSAIA